MLFIWLYKWLRCGVKYTIRCLCIAFVFFTGPSLAGGNVFVGGKEWLVPASTGGYSYEQVAAVCPLPSGKCSGTLPIPNNSAVDVTGYYWAFPTDVDELFNSYGTVKKQFFEDFGSGEDKGELLQ